MIDRQQLADQLGVGIAAIDSWIAQGMPTAGEDQIEYDDASKWLIAEGIAASPDDVVHTLTELAAVLDVRSTITAASRRDSPGFPSGPPWRRSEILAWQDKQDSGGGGGSKSNTKAELERIKLEQATLRLRREQGEVLPLDDVVDEMQRQHGLARQKILTLIPRLLQLLPADTDPRVIAEYRQQARKVIDDFLLDISTAFRGDA